MSDLSVEVPELTGAMVRVGELRDVRHLPPF